MMRTALDQLAERCGIQSSLVDAFGKVHHTRNDVKLALLAAMHYPVSSEQEAEAALSELESREWGTPLPPVLVVEASQAVIVPVNVPESLDKLLWNLTLEDKSILSGHAHCSGLTVVDQYQRDGQVLHRLQLPLPANLPYGYHSLRLEQYETEMLLIVTPGKCLLPQSDRCWGLAAALFLIRSEHNWGMGDFTDLRNLVKLSHRKQADVVGLNPLHALFLDDPEQASPYSPSDRILLNALYIDVEAIPELAGSEPAQKLIASERFQEQLALARRSHLVQYETVAELKLAVLRLLFATLEEQEQSPRLQQFEAFHQERKTLLDRTCQFQALRAHFSSQTPALLDCHDWPEEYRTSHSPGVAAFAEEHAELVRFHLWLQWIADNQLQEANAAAEGMAVGLYRDLAVGSHPGGAEVWSYPGSLVSGAAIGAPPDILSPAGQNWGLPPLHPIAAREHAYRSFIDVLQANMRHAGGLRIDHAMGLLRLYWIPEGNEPRDGAYVHYPVEDLIGILALESHRNQCLVVAEDLGTVPEGFSERLNAANILSYRVLFFEKDEKGFFPPESYPRLALSVASNHDLATVRGWWRASDIDLREHLGLFPHGADDARKERELDKQHLLTLLAEQDLVPPGKPVDVNDIADAVHAFLGRTGSLISMAQIDDVTGEEEQINVPGTAKEHPNWRRRLSRTLEELATDPRLNAVARRMSNARKAIPEYQL